MTKTVYLLRDPRDNAVHYVGATRNPNKRIGEHVRNAREKKPRYVPVHAWVRETLPLGGPVLEELETVPEASALARERHWIWHFMLAGAPLANVKRGLYCVVSPKRFWRDGLPRARRERRCAVCRQLGHNRSTCRERAA